ncbi:MAG TPA: CoA transferase [Blastocatellia bacterium]|jgi:crotonobetainyl-CoA:carnitine CoA-transferase CaiB-like acyl-CoA transferase|nr:CoA transferase [Blastocatellia bacterium]
MPGPLTGVRVIDLTSVVMGPYATQILGDMGADVIKVESPGGDVFRQVTPFRHRGMSAGFLNLNRNKRSVALDLRREDERQVLLDLITGADVFVTTVRPQAMRKLGLDYESLRERNPRLIYCGAYGFSEAGPYAGRPAFDDIIQAMCGMASLQGEKRGENEANGPRYVNTIFADKTVGCFIAYAVAMALYERERSGRGQAIEVPMFETMVSFTLIEHLAGETFCPAQGGMGYDRVLSEHRRPYQTKDGYIGLLPYTAEQWTRFFEAAGRPEMAAAPRVTDPALRSGQIAELYSLLAEIVAERTTAEWVELLRAADLPITLVLSPEDLLEDEHLQALGFFRREEHPTEGEVRTIGIPVRFSRTPGDIRRLAPRLNEHREEILLEMEVEPGPGF